MRERIIDCRAGTKTWREYTKEEEAARLVEMAETEEMERREKTARTKENLLGVMANLEHAKVLKVEGIFTDDDVEDCRRRADELKTEMRALTRTG